MKGRSNRGWVPKRDSPRKDTLLYGRTVVPRLGHIMTLDRGLFREPEFQKLQKSRWLEKRTLA